MLRIISSLGILSILIFFQVSILEAQSTSLPELAMGTRSLALGQTASISFSDALATAMNPASAINAKKFTASLFYSKLPSETTSTSFGIAIPTTNYGTFGLSYYRMSGESSVSTAENTEIWMDSFRQSHFIVTYARTLIPKLASGINAKFVTQHVGEMSTGPENVGLDFAVQYTTHINNSIFKNFAVGLSIDNLIQPTITISKTERLLREYRFISEQKIIMGAENSVNLITNFVLKEQFSHQNENSIEIQKALSRLMVHLGLEYIHQNVFLRMGYFSNSFSGGLEMKMKSFDFGYSYGTFGKDDGLSRANHGISISYKF